MPGVRRSTSYISSKLPLRIPVVPSLRITAPGRLTTSGARHDRLTSRTSDSPTHVPLGANNLALTLPVPPSINHQYATVNGRRLLSSAGRAYKAQVGQLVWMGLSQLPQRSSLLACLQAQPLALSITFYFTSGLRRDVDGGLKIAQDALCEGLGINDNRIIETHLFKRVDKNNPRIEVSLSVTSRATEAVSEP